jgi:hypothetical protein
MRAQRRTTQSEPDNVLHLYPAQPRPKRQSALLKQLLAHLDKLYPWIDEKATPAERALVVRTLKECADSLSEARAKRFPKQPPLA